LVFVYNRARIEDADIEKEIIKLYEAITPQTKRETKHTVKTHLTQSYNDGRSSAQEEIDKAADEAPTKSLKERLKLTNKLTKPVAISGDWSIMDFVEGLKPDTALKYFEAKGFKTTMDITETMMAGAEQVLLDGLKNEWSDAEVIEQLQEILSPLVGKIDKETGEPDKQERARLETIVRTNLSDSFNQARLAIFNDPELGDFVKAFEYSSILDARTTSFCKQYDGRIFKKSDPVWQQITPPNHFNCRATTISVTEFDEFVVAPKGTEQPGNGFGKVP